VEFCALGERQPAVEFMLLFLCFVLSKLKFDYEGTRG
jgi:hypothetical protein